MKKFRNLIALLLAATMMLSLAACGDDSNDNDDDDDKEKTSEKDKATVAKSPEKFYDLLNTEDDFILTIVVASEEATTNGEFIKDGNKIQLTSSVESEDYSTTAKQYVDFDAGIGYEYSNFDDQWVTGEIDFTWQGEIQQINEQFPIFDNALYEKEGKTYTMTEDGLESVDSAEVITAVTMKYTSSNATLTIVTDECTYTLCLEITDTDVELPSVGPVTPGTEGTTTPGTEGGDAPNTSVEPGVDETPDTLPSEIYKMLINYDNVTMDATNGEIHVTIERDGHLWHLTQDGEEIIYDDQTCTAYRYSDGWYSSSVEYISPEEMFSGYDLTKNAICFNDSAFDDYDSSLGYYYASDEALSDYGYYDAFIRYQGGNNFKIAIFSSVDSYCTYQISFGTADVVLPTVSAPVTEPSDPTTDVENTYTSLKPSEIWTALITADSVTLYAESSQYCSTYIKDNDILYVYSTDTYGNVVTEYYYCISTNMIYMSDGEGNFSSQTSNTAFTWSDFVSMCGLSASTYIFVDSYYESFDEYDSTLYIKSQLLYGSGLSEVYMERQGCTYTIYEIPDSGETSIVAFNFEQVDLTLPA